MVGAVGSYVLSVRYGIPQVASLLVLAPLGAAVGYVSQRVAVQPFLERSRAGEARGGLTHDTIVSTVGLGLTIAAVVTLYFGTDDYAIPPYVSSAIQHIGPIPIRPIFVVMFVCAAVVTAAIDFIIVRSGLGRVLRAVITDPEGATLLGIDVVPVVSVAFVVAGALATVAGWLLVPLTSANVFVGERLALLGFVAMALGGFGSFRGAIVGGLLVGLMTGVGPIFVDTLLIQPLLLVLLVIGLAIRPGGLFGAAGEYGSGVLREV
jgi:branched-chain amino acid transport system permease protein